MYVGGQRLNSLVMEWEETEAGREGVFDERKYLNGFDCWLAPARVGWARFSLENILSWDF
jgi:hypothetical protein